MRATLMMSFVGLMAVTSQPQLRVETVDRGGDELQSILAATGRGNGNGNGNVGNNNGNGNNGNNNGNGNVGNNNGNGNVGNGFGNGNVGNGLGNGNMGNGPMHGPSFPWGRPFHFNWPGVPHGWTFWN